MRYELVVTMRQQWWPRRDITAATERRMLAGMWICIRCHTEFPEFTGTAEPNIDDFGPHFMCPECGRRNRLRSLGRDEEGFLLLEQVDEPE